MNTIINIIKNHKRTIATIAGPVLAWAQAKAWIDAQTSMMLAGVLSAWSGAALFHAAVKAKT